MAAVQQPAPGTSTGTSLSAGVRRGGAGDDLRMLRGHSGVSQRELARRCGLTDRTIRGLESGAIRNPQRETLLRLAAALGLDAHERRRFLTAWRDQRRPVVLNDVLASDKPPSEEIERRLQQQFGATRPIARSSVVTVGPNRRIVGTAIAISIVVTSGELAEWLVAHTTDTVAACHPTVSGQGGSTFERTWLVEEGSYLYVLDLHQTLRVGDTHVLRYEIDSGTTELPLLAIDEDYSMDSLATSLSSLSTEIRFHPQMLPDAVYHCSARRIGAPMERGRPVPLTSDHGAHLVLDRPGPGVHGLLWTWSDRTAAGDR